MRCINTSECFEQISAYFDGKKTGYFLLVNQRITMFIRKYSNALRPIAARDVFIFPKIACPTVCLMSMQPSLLQAVVETMP